MDIRRRAQIGGIKKTSSGGESTTGGTYTVNLNSQWEKTTTISNPDSTLYDGVYRSSSNYNVNSGVAIMYITVKDCSSFKMYIRSYAETTWDYVMVSQLDKTITGSTAYSDTTLVKAHTRGNQQSGTALSSYTLVEYTGITSGEHTITVVYRKDGSAHSGDDRGYVLIEKSQAGSGDSGEGGGDIEIDPTTIYYTSSDGNIVTPYSTGSFGAKILSNNYIDGQGIISFDGPVTTIGKMAFQNCESLTSITIPDSVTMIGIQAFWGCGGLTSVNIPDNVTSIGFNAFWFCGRLTNITIPEGVTSIGSSAFYSCGRLTSVYCKAITPPTLGNANVFGNNGSGRIIYVPTGSVNAYKSAEYWSEYADAIVGYDFEDDGEVDIDTTYAIYYTSSDGNIVTPNNTDVFGVNIVSNNYINGQGIISFDGPVTMIGDQAFYLCNSLTSVNLPDSVTRIGKNAFWHCSGLTSVTIPDSVTTIGDGAFEDCYYLTSVTIGDSVTAIGERAFESCSSLQEFNGKFASEDGRCLIIGRYLNSFAPAGLTKYTIPDSVTTIGGYAFYWCKSLKSITIPDSVTTIGVRAFYECSKLTSVTIGDSVTTIGSEAFENCNSLTSVTIPDSVITIGDYAFYRCYSLTSVYCKATTPPVGGSLLFYENASGHIIYVPTGSVNAYKSAPNWSEYADAIVGYNF